MGYVIKGFRLPNGEVQIMVDGEVPFAEAAKVDAALHALLGAEIPGFKTTQGAEQHKPDGGIRHVHILPEIRQGSR